jgi:ubiquitin-conjugating enzyme E2 H
MVSAINKRKEKDVMKLLVSEYEVQNVNENTNNEFLVKFHGPKESAYEGVRRYN